MATTVAPERQRYRPYFIVSLPILFLAYIIAVAYVLANNQSVCVAVPLVVVGFCLSRLMRWLMVWLSTPDERKIFARSMDYEPGMSVLRELASRWRGPTEPPKV